MKIVFNTSTYLLLAASAAVWGPAPVVLAAKNEQGGLRATNDAAAARELEEGNSCGNRCWGPWKGDCINPYNNVCYPKIPNSDPSQQFCPPSTEPCVAGPPPKCMNSAPYGGQDEGCTEDSPICVGSNGQEIAFNTGGASCAPCINSFDSGMAQADFGCEAWRSPGDPRCVLDDGAIPNVWGAGTQCAGLPSASPSVAPSAAPSAIPSVTPSTAPSTAPSSQPSELPSLSPSAAPSTTPSSQPSAAPSEVPATLVLWEVVGSTTGTDVEFIEIQGEPGQSLDRLSIIVVECDDEKPVGNIDKRLDLTGGVVGCNGKFLVGVAAVNPDQEIPNNFVENSSYTIAIVSGLTSSVTNAADVPSENVVDAVGVQDNRGTNTFFFGAPVVGPDGSYLPAGFQRLEDGSYVFADFGITDNTPEAAGGCGGPPGVANVLIHDIQGNFDSYQGLTVRVEAVVVGDFQFGDADESRNLGGFHIQEEDADADADPSTSEGIFVYSIDVDLDVIVGDLVEVEGTVQDFRGETQIRATSVVIKESGVALPSASVVVMPAGDLSAFEGMLVTFPQELKIVEMFNLDRYSEVRLFPGDRPFQFTQQNSPETGAFQDYVNDIQSKWIFYDDGRAGNTNDVTPFDGFTPYSTATAPRMGDIVALEGVMSYERGAYRVRSVVDGSVQVTKVNPRPLDPPAVGGSLKIASLNVLNFFVTLRDSGNTAGPGGLSPRGASNAEEFDRQLAKLVTAIVQLDADIVGLLEVENNFPVVLSTLVAAVNAALGGGDEYNYVDPGRSFVDVGDAISVGYIYKSTRASVIGTPAILDDSALPAGMSGPIFDGPSTNRASLAVTFESIADTTCLTLAINHFKSKGGSGSGADADQNDGQGNWNDRRTKGAQAVLEWLPTNPTGVACEFEAIMGDLNAYAKEDPIQTILNAGYKNVEPDDAYSFVFDGQIGTLDYILLNDALFSLMTGAGVWHINEDEADALDYNLDFGRPADFFDASVPFRCSDHSPVLVGLNTAAAGN